MSPTVTGSSAPRCSSAFSVTRTSACRPPGSGSATSGGGVAVCVAAAAVSTVRSTTCSPMSSTRRRSRSPALSSSGSCAASGVPASMRSPIWPWRSITRAGERHPGAERELGELGAQQRGLDAQEIHSPQGSCRRADEGDMERGLYIAASGMVAEMARQDLIANDLANSSTPATRPTARSREASATSCSRTRRPASTIGTLGNGARIERAGHRSEPPRRSRRPARTSTSPSPGDGYFAVQTAQGMRYTRNGQFTLGANGRLLDQTSATPSSARTASRSPSAPTARCPRARSGSSP